MRFSPGHERRASWKSVLLQGEANPEKNGGPMPSTWTKVLGERGVGKSDWVEASKWTISAAALVEGAPAPLPPAPATTHPTPSPPPGARRHFCFKF